MRKLLALGGALLLLSGCASPGAEHLSIRKGDSHSQDYWTNHSVMNEHAVSVTLYGSSSCPPTPYSALVFTGDDGVQYIDIELEPQEPQIACTMDYSPHTYIIESNRTKFREYVEVRIAEDVDERPSSVEPRPVDPIEPGPVKTSPVEPPEEK